MSITLMNWPTFEFLKTSSDTKSMRTEPKMLSKMKYFGELFLFLATKKIGSWNHRAEKGLKESVFISHLAL